MAKFTFTWPHAAEEVYVTGTFDDWSKSEKLEKVGDVFQKTVTLPQSTEKIWYKFVVDGTWTTDHAAPQEKDHEGNENNVLLPKDMEKLEEAAGPAAAILNSVAPESTTAQLAGAVPLENTKADVSTIPGGYPETPLTDLDKQVKVNPLPATDGALNPIKLEPGQKIPDDVTAGNINDNVTLDKESYEQSDRLPGLNKEVKISPLPATDGALNPPGGITTGSTTDHVTLDKDSYERSDRLPGDDKEFKVSPLPATDGALNPPGGVTSGSITDNVTLDKESYEKSDRLPGDDKEFKVSPLPATDGALNPPGGVATGSVTDHVTLDKESYENSDRLPEANKEFKVSPLPATEGALNPPGGVATGSITDHVTLDKESYEKSDRIPGLETSLPPISGNMIPESSLPIAGPNDVTINTVTPSSTTAALAGAVPLEKKPEAEISSAAPTSTTAALAGEVPLEKKPDATISTVTPGSTTAALAGQVPIEEPKVPEVVKQSQKDAHVEPEASAIDEEVREKAAVEEELLQTVAKVPSTSEGTAGKGTEKSETDLSLADAVSAAATSASAAFVGAALAVGTSALAAGSSAGHAATDAAAKLPDSVRSHLPASFQKAVPKAVVAPQVPVEVQDSIRAAGETAEAAANPVAVEDKKEVEAELLKDVKRVEAAPTGAKAYAADTVAAQVPTEVKDSIAASGQSVEAAANPAAVEDKKDVETELLKEVKKVEAVEPAKPEETTAAAAAVETNGGTKAAAPKTTEEAPASAPVAASTSRPANAASPSVTERKKRHRLSAFMSKIKHKVSGKDSA